MNKSKQEKKRKEKKRKEGWPIPIFVSFSLLCFAFCVYVHACTPALLAPFFFPFLSFPLLLLYTHPFTPSTSPLSTC